MSCPPAPNSGGGRGQFSPRLGARGGAWFVTVTDSFLGGHGKCVKLFLLMPPNGAGVDDLGGLPAHLILRLGTPAQPEHPMQTQLLDKIHAHTATVAITSTSSVQASAWATRVCPWPWLSGMGEIGEAHDPKSPHYRHHRPGRFLSDRTASLQGLQSPHHLPAWHLIRLIRGCKIRAIRGCKVV